MTATEAPGWIVVRNIDKYLHRDALRGQGTPPWHPTYAKLVSKDEYLHLNSHCRAILHGVWLLYLNSDGRLQLDTAMLSRRLALRVLKSNIETLTQAGFLTIVASRPPALRTQIRRSDAGLEERIGDIPPYPLKGETQKTETPANPRALGTNPRAQGTNPRAGKPTNTKTTRAARALINGQGWDTQATDEQSIRDELRRISQRVDHTDLPTHLEDELIGEWQLERQRRTEKLDSANVPTAH